MENIITPEDAFEFLQQNKAVFIDVRTRSEYEGGHIPGALNMDIYEPHFADDIYKFGREKMYIMNCQTGGRSGRATEFMASLGFKKVFNLMGGFSAWKMKDLPLSKEK